MAEGTVQSLERGLQIMELLARDKVMTATQIGASLGIHQSSASRLLNSLVRSGFVRKPDYRSFALDYGALIFAGRAMDCFPVIEKATAVCNGITRKYGYSATVAILKSNHLLYLTRSNEDASLVLIDSHLWPLSQSVPGLILACEQGEERAVTLFTKYDQLKQKEAVSLYKKVVREQNEEGFLLLAPFGSNKFNGGLPFSLDDERAALAVFSPTRPALGRDKMKKILEEGTQAI